MKTIYAITSSPAPSLNMVKFFDTEELAIFNLNKLANDRKHNFGVRHFKQEDKKFSFVLGWEGYSVSFRIEEIYVEEQVENIVENVSKPIKLGRKIKSQKIC
jgi:hypothetical protein